MDVTLTDAVGYLAAAVVFLTFCMKTMFALRLIAVASNLAFIAYALAADLMPILVLHGALLPLNLFRLFEMQRQIRRASEAARLGPTEDRFDWLVPFGVKRELAPGATLFRKGDPATSLFVVIEGAVRLPEIGSTLGAGSVVGEIGLFSGEGSRTTSAEAVGTVKLAELSERRVQELYFDNPNFAYRLIRLITRRLVLNVARLEERLERDATAEMRELGIVVTREGVVSPSARRREEDGDAERLSLRRDSGS